MSLERRAQQMLHIHSKTVRVEFLRFLSQRHDGGARRRERG